MYYNILVCWRLPRTIVLDYCLKQPIEINAFYTRTTSIVTATITIHVLVVLIIIIIIIKNNNNNNNNKNNNDFLILTRA